MVVCRGGDFQTFNRWPPRNKGAKVTPCLSGLTAPNAMDSMGQITAATAEQFGWPDVEVAWSAPLQRCC